MPSPLVESEFRRLYPNKVEPLPDNYKPFVSPDFWELYGKEQRESDREAESLISITVCACLIVAIVTIILWAAL